MAFGFPARYESTFSNVPPGTDIRRAVGSALAKMGWKPTSEGNGYRASTTFSMASWGERITVQFLPGDRSFKIRSQCSFFLAVLDWGKNQKNVEKFLDELPRHYISLPATASLA
ncbi:MAG: hypothetical protein JST12_03025 [Armatimonadetes bacterium]|nr:hypothetical protein [Armatimonadota bacterium]MBS1700608.1 hypothetical protein [Armatimonadota bacterium]MBS1728908.1 hypothetical protein [Armatimonadota bacterium]